MGGITTHVLNTASGRPAEGVTARLEKQNGESWELLGEGQTNSDGRLRDLLTPDYALKRGVYRITFETGAYFGGLGLKTFFPSASIVFTVEDPAQHFHVPLLLSPFGYSTYRGS